MHHKHYYHSDNGVSMENETGMGRVVTGDHVAIVQLATTLTTLIAWLHELGQHNQVKLINEIKENVFDVLNEKYDPR